MQSLRYYFENLINIINALEIIDNEKDKGMPVFNIENILMEEELDHRTLYNIYITQLPGQETYDSSSRRMSVLKDEYKGLEYIDNIENVEDWQIEEFIDEMTDKYPEIAKLKAGEPVQWGEIDDLDEKNRQKKKIDIREEIKKELQKEIDESELENEKDIDGNININDLSSGRQNNERQNDEFMPDLNKNDKNIQYKQAEQYKQPYKKEKSVAQYSGVAVIGDPRMLLAANAAMTEYNDSNLQMAYDEFDEEGCIESGNSIYLTQNDEHFSQGKKTHKEYLPKKDEKHHKHKEDCLEM